MFIGPMLAKALVVAQGNLIVRGTRAVDLAPIEAALATGLRAGAPATTLAFESSGERRPFEAWLTEARSAGLRDIDLIPVAADLAPTLLALDFSDHGCEFVDCRWERSKPDVPLDKAPLLLFAPVDRVPVQRTRPTPTLSEACANLEAALVANLEVASSGGWTTWSDWFGEALERLSAPADPQAPWVAVTAGCGVPSALPALAHATEKSHVFGGMGSWNDCPTDNDVQRKQLWDAMNDSWASVFATLHAHATGGLG